MELRGKHPRWGPKKLCAYLEREYPQRVWPALSTVGELLKREGLSIPQARRRRTPLYTEPFLAAVEPNLVWCADFKGWFRTGDGERIDPLTLTDAHSRFLLRCQAVDRANTEHVRAIFEAAFREYGMPLAMHTDNGPPFATRAVAGLSALSIYLMKLGIVPERSRPAHPEDNGRHERMHRTLKAETARPPSANRRAQQRAFDQFRYEFNEVRPHEALGQQTPASCHTISTRTYPTRILEPEYDSGLQVRRVMTRGQFGWKHQAVFLSKALAGERVALEAIDDRYWLIRFCTTPLARFDSRRLRVEKLPKTKPK